MVDVKGLTRRFDRNTALRNVDFEAREGMVYGLVGPNGAGKSTLIRHILGLLKPTAGTVRVFGHDPVRQPVEVLRRVGYLSEERELPEWMRIDELMRYTRAYYPNWDPAYAAELMATFGLDGRKEVRELSKGTRAQVALVAAVAHRPDLLILDEPSTGLDPMVRRDILDAIVRTVADDGRTVIFSSHLLDEVERMSDHVTMIHEGRIVLADRLDSLRSAHLRTQIRFSERLVQAPAIAGALTLEGEGRSWSVVHTNPAEGFQSSLAAQQGEVVQSREATLEEIFVARVGRGIPAVEAA